MIDRWLCDSVMPVFDRVAAGTEPLVDAHEVFSGLEARYLARRESGRG
jgi:antitoxin ParD1/3/4